MPKVTPCNFGMTCGPIGGLVQTPCIERKVSLDQAIKTMYLTGLNMQSRYKETPSPDWH